MVQHTLWIMFIHLMILTIKVINVLMNVITLHIIQFIISHKFQIMHYIVQMNVQRIKNIGLEVILH